MKTSEIIEMAMPYIKDGGCTCTYFALNKLVDENKITEKQKNKVQLAFEYALKGEHLLSLLICRDNPVFQEHYRVVAFNPNAKKSQRSVDICNSIRLTWFMNWIKKLKKEEKENESNNLS